MEMEVISRQHYIPPHGIPLSPDDITNHVYPFATLPLLESHVHPKFVIADAGIKLVSFTIDELKELFKNYPDLAYILSLYNAWIRPLNARQLNDPSFIVPKVNDEDDDDDGDGDNNDDSDYDDRPPSQRSRKRKAPANSQAKSQRSNPKRHASSKRSRPKGKPLSQTRLSCHNQLLGKRAWTYDRIRKWSNRKRRKLCRSNQAIFNITILISHQPIFPQFTSAMPALNKVEHSPVNWSVGC